MYESSRTPGQQDEGRTIPWRSWTLFLLTVAGVLGCFGLLQVLLFPLVGAVGIAVGLRTPLRALRRRCTPTVAALLLLTGLCVAVVLPGFFVVRSLAGEIMVTLHHVQNGGADRDFHRLTERHRKIGRALQDAVDQLTPDEAGKRFAQQGAMWLGRGLRKFVRGVTELVLLLFFLFFLLRDQEAALGLLASLIPLNDGETTQFMTRLGDLVFTVFVGRLMMAGIQGALAGLAYWVLGVPGALLWAVLTAVCCLIPAFGSLLVWVPVALYLGLAATWTKALLLAIWGGVVVSNVDNVLYPIVVGRRTQLHTAAIFVSIFGGMALFGVSGLVLGPVIVASTMLLLQIWKERVAEGDKLAGPL